MVLYFFTQFDQLYQHTSGGTPFTGHPVYTLKMERGVTLIVLTDNITQLSTEELQYVPKVILLKKFGHYIDHLWNKLPKHIKVDPEVQGYRRCAKHYNQPWQRTHIDGPAPCVKYCDLCQNGV